MTDHETGSQASPQYLPTMTEDYSRISATAQAVTVKVLPGVTGYIRSILPRIKRMSSAESFIIADYGSADGFNDSALFEQIVAQIRAVNTAVRIKLFYIDIADPSGFTKFWSNSGLAQFKGVEAEYIQRSFYRPFPEIAGKLNLGFSSTSLHWLDTKTAAADFFQHPACIQANQLPEVERRRFVEKWKDDWRSFFCERTAELVKGGALYLANLTNRGGDQWPASAGYNNLRDVCHDLFQDGRITAAEMNAIFVPDYFAAPEEMRALLKEARVKRAYSLKSFDTLTVPCVYFTRAKGQLGDTQARAELARTLAHVVRAWSESSIRTGLSPQNKDEVEEIYRRLGDKFYQTPRGLPYEYCLIELVKK